MPAAVRLCFPNFNFEVLENLDGFYLKSMPFRCNDKVIMPFLSVFVLGGPSSQAAAEKVEVGKVIFFRQTLDNRFPPVKLLGKC
jgi:hypothetical protein